MTIALETLVIQLSVTVCGRQYTKGPSMVESNDLLSRTVELACRITEVFIGV